MIWWNSFRAFVPILLAPLALSVPSVAIDSAGAQAAESIKLKIHNIGPPRGFLIPLVKWSENVNAATGGSIQFDILWGGVLGTWENQIDNIKAGTFDIGPISPSFLEAKAPLMSSGELPFISSNVVAYGKAALEWLKMPELEKEMAAWNQKLLFFTVAPDQEYWGKKPIRSLDDFRGLRAWSGGVFGRALSALGGTPILVPVSELGMGLQRGTFDGIFTGKHLHLAQETYLFSKYPRYPRLRRRHTGDIHQPRYLERDSFRPPESDARRGSKGPRNVHRDLWGHRERAASQVGWKGRIYHLVPRVTG